MSSELRSVPNESPSAFNKFVKELRRVEPWQGTKRMVKRILEIYRRPEPLEETLRELGVTVGKDVQLQPFSLDERYARLLTIEDHSSIGKGTTIYLSDGILNTLSEDPDPPPVRFGPVRICKGATVSRDAIILCGVTIGEYSIVGAGSLVAHDVRPGTVVMGVPAREVCTVDQLKRQARGDENARKASQSFSIHMPNWRQRKRIGMRPEEQDVYFHENFPKHGY